MKFESPPSKEIRDRDLLIAAKGIQKRVERWKPLGLLFGGVFRERFLQRHLPELKVYATHFISQTRWDWRNRGLADAETEQFFQKWRRLLQSHSSLGRLWSFAVESQLLFIERLGSETEKSKYFEGYFYHLREHVVRGEEQKSYRLIGLQDSQLDPRVFPLPVAWALSFEMRSRLFLLKTPPITLQFRKDEVRSDLDRLTRGRFEDFYHDFDHARLRYPKRLGYPPDDLKKLSRFIQLVDSLPSLQKPVGLFFQDMLVSEKPDAFTRKLGKSHDFTKIQDLISSFSKDFYLRSRYAIVEDSRVLPVHIDANHEDAYWRDRGVIDRRESLLKDLGLPLEMSWENLQSLIDEVEKVLIRELRKR